MQFTPVNKADIPRTRRREGKISTQLISAFLESGLDLVQVDAADIEATGKKMESVRSTVSNYVKRHEQPVKVFTAGGGLYLERSDEAQAKYVRENAEAAAKANEPTPEAAPAPAEGE